MRKFWLENEFGKKWNLTPKDPYDKDSSFFADPSGLGIQTKVTSYEVENTCFIEEIETQTQTISGNLYFSSYEHFTNFVEFVGNINTTTPLKLYYSTEGISFDYSLESEWYKLVLINEIDKSEIDYKTGFLKCKVKFMCLSRWKKDKKIVLELNRYGEPLVYPYYYPYFYGGSNNLAVDIDNEGNLPTSCVIKIEAVTDAPFIRVIQDGEIKDQAKYNLIVNENSYLLIDSSPDSQEASLYTKVDDNYVKEDVYYIGEKDYSYSNFITIPSGKSTIVFSATNTDFGKVTISYSIQKELV